MNAVFAPRAMAPLPPAGQPHEFHNVIVELVALTNDLGEGGAARLLALTRCTNRRIQAMALGAYMAVLQDREMAYAEFVALDRFTTRP